MRPLTLNVLFNDPEEGIKIVCGRELPIKVGKKIRFQSFRKIITSVRNKTLLMLNICGHTHKTSKSLPGVREESIVNKNTSCPVLFGSESSVLVVWFSKAAASR